MSFQDSTPAHADAFTQAAASARSKALDALADKLLENCVDQSSHMLEAIRACCQRIEAAVDPIRELPREREGARHG